MKESQHIEWKQSWRDEYLKWICGFANAQGGTLVIGKNDRGEVRGLANAAKLLEDIPNKVRDVLGMVVPVNLHSYEGKDWLEILVESYPSPISYKGEYHFRQFSGHHTYLFFAGRSWAAMCAFFGPVFLSPTGWFFFSL